MTPSALSLPQAIYDTGLVLQAALSPNGISERALQYIGHKVAAVVSDRLRSEYELVLTRPSLQKKYPILRDAFVVQAQLDRIDVLAERVSNPPERILYPRDPKDAPLVNLAIHIQAAYLISWDKDLLDLNHDPVFRHTCPLTRVLNPLDFVREMERKV